MPVKVKYLQTVPNETKNRTSRPLSIKSLKKHMDFIPVQRELKILRAQALASSSLAFGTIDNQGFSHFGLDPFLLAFRRVYPEYCFSREGPQPVGHLRISANERPASA